MFLTFLLSRRHFLRHGVVRAMHSIARDALLKSVISNDLE